MTKNTLSTLVAYLTKNDIPELADVKAELLAQAEKNEAKAQANRDLYAAAKAVVLDAIDEAPKTVAEIYESCADNLPETFSKSKVQYALTNYWADEVTKHDNGKKPFTYSRRP